MHKKHRIWDPRKTGHRISPAFPLCPLCLFVADPEWRDKLLYGSVERSGMNAEFLEEAGRLAQAAVERGEGGPFGAVIVSGGQVVSRGWNQVLLACDPTAHAEIVAIRDASRRLGRFHLADCELYSSCEPCPMCLAAAYWAEFPPSITPAPGRMPRQRDSRMPRCIRS